MADVVEAMASPRPYRPALGIDKALDEIRKNRGILYDENVVDACLTLFQDKGFQFGGGGVTGFDATAGKEQPRNRSVSQDWSETIFKGRP